MVRLFQGLENFQAAWPGPQENPSPPSVCSAASCSVCPEEACWESSASPGVKIAPSTGPDARTPKTWVCLAASASSTGSSSFPL